MDIMTSSRPYLLRGVYEWIADNDMTPFVVVNAEYPGVSVPHEHVEDGKIILNVSETAVRKLIVSNEAIEFDARFSGVVRRIYAPIAAITAIYARENGRGIVFDDNDSAMSEGAGGAAGGMPPPAGTSGKTPPKGKKGKPTLTIVK